ncbi:MAG: YbaK/EbsC family protein [Actinobacteria bacterium]|nr:YbaK/EbsC family protein [Actinomycetota bacterium]
MTLPSASQRFVEQSAELGYIARPMVFPQGTKTSQDAANAAGCLLSQIAKSIVLTADGDPIVVLMSGDHRVDTKALAQAIGVDKVRRADLDVVRAATGYAAGGTPPFAHATPVMVYVDVSLKRNDEVWVAAGTPSTIFPMPLATMVEVAKAKWVDVAE